MIIHCYYLRNDHYLLIPYRINYKHFDIKLFKYILLIMLLQLSQYFFPFIPFLLVSPPTHPPAFLLPLTSCPWVVYISYLASPLPILFLTPPVYLYLPILLLIPCTSPPVLLLPLPIDNPACDLHFCDSIPVLVVCLVCFGLGFFRSSC